MNYRIKNIYAELEKVNLDGFIVSDPANISYLTYCTSRDSYLIISKKNNVYLTDSRYLQEAKLKLNSNFSIKKINGSVFKILAGVCVKLGIRRIGFEERHLPYAEYKKIDEELGKKGELIPTHNMVEEARQVKSQEELKKIKRAVRITIGAFKFIKDFISAGKKEIEIAAELERFIRYSGACMSAFDIIVASGPNSSFPHHLTSGRKIKSNEVIMIDLGVDYRGYKSDLTRVFFSGKISPIIRRIYDIVRRAQEEAIKKIRPGTKINEIDKAARQYITQRGYGGFFGHNLGHGVGLEVHEAPYISSKETNKLRPGMVFTIEPAIYLPGKFGIRIEDMVLVTQRGVELLSGGLDK
jgi:Xaa-Pro aminopeptidase